jgi:phage terminase large subunit-like protein
MAKTLAQTKRELESLLSISNMLTESQLVELAQAIRALNLEATLQNREAERDRLLSDYSYFFRQAWEWVESARLLWNWHHKLQCDYLQALYHGVKVRDLVMNVPPGTSKSLNSMVVWPAWVFAKNPSERLMTASYDLDLVAKQSVATKDLINSEWYQAFFGDRVQISPKADTQTYWETTAGGWRFATTPKGKSTGRHPSILAIDDPVNVKQADSEKERPAINDWWDKTMVSRGAGKSLNRRRLIVMQRLHEADLTGHVLKTGQWTHFVLPMRYEPNRMADIGIGKDPRTTEGELLWPEMFDEAAVKEAERSLGMDAAGQLQQRPMAKGGGIFKTDRFRTIPLSALPVQTIKRFKRAWDKAATPDAGCFTAGVFGGIEYTPRNEAKTEWDETVYIIDVVRGQWGSGDVERQIDLWSRVDGAQYGEKYETVFEREGGSAGIQAAEETTRRLRGRRIRAISTGGKAKPIRWNGLANAIYRREVVLVEAAWNTAFIQELQNVPKGEFKDQADAASLLYSELVSPSAIDSLHDDDEDDQTESYERCANNLCDRLAVKGSDYCCHCCEAAHDAGVRLFDNQHEPNCNQRHNQLAAKGEWEPASMID